MSKKVIESVNRIRALHSETDKEQKRSRDLLVSYFLVLREVMKEGQKLTFHDPAYYNDRPYKGYSVIFQKDKVTEIQGSETNSKPILDYLHGLYKWDLPITGLSKTMEDIENSPLNQTVSPKAVEEKYKKYTELFKSKKRRRDTIQAMLKE